MSSGKTLFEKIWNSHVVEEIPSEANSTDTQSLLYIDRHFIHEVTSPQAFEGIRINGRKVRRPDLTFATMDHNVPTNNRSLPIIDQTSANQVEVLKQNCKQYGIRLFDLASPEQGIVHVIGPQLGLTLPGSTIVCGDSHTSTQGAFGALAFGIGTSDVEHVLATQCIKMKKPKTLEIKTEGRRSDPQAVTAKDIILFIIRKIGTAGGAGFVVEYSGDTIGELNMEERMTISNMSIEAGARAGLMAPDYKTFDYLSGTKYLPENYDECVKEWKNNLTSDTNASFDKRICINANEISPQVSWGTNPAMTCSVDDIVPYPEEYADGSESEEKSAKRALDYMGLIPGMPITDIKLDRVFIGSCTNSRLSDLVQAAHMVKGRKVSSQVRAMVVPGSQQVKKQAEELGIDKTFKDAGFEWRESGCSMCLGMNPDILGPKERCASTSNRNFEGRQGAGGRTHLVSPIMAAAAAIYGHFVDVRDLNVG